MPGFYLYQPGSEQNPRLAILDTGAPGNIISSQLVKKLKLAPDLAYHEQFDTAGPQTTISRGAYSSLPLCFGKLMVTAPAIALENNIYDIIIGTSFMVHYDTVTNHGDHMFMILGHFIPMFHHGDRPSDLPLCCLYYINLEYTDGELPVAYTLCSKKVKVLPLLVGEAKGIPVYASCNVTIPPGSQMIHNTGLLLALPAGTHGEIFGIHNASRLELTCLAPGDNIQEDTVGNLYSKRFEVQS
ncbi:hypothetical protein DSO57_1024556 [Entomophthora muscae]|uniref:Uncharacterized protein n=1 Tax=Entomophthora muscae TaxID=34485 RepID=A0ACC2RH58_9FUNG|nr:hypothetical protein DSO57_1024556 [Entomophthora muscae]